jgi:hypothetical protein
MEPGKWGRLKDKCEGQSCVIFVDSKYHPSANFICSFHILKPNEVSKQTVPERTC